MGLDPWRSDACALPMLGYRLMLRKVVQKVMQLELSVINVN